MALHVSLQVLLTLESSIAARFFALELDLLDDRRKVLEHQVLLGGLPSERLSRPHTVGPPKPVPVHWRRLEFVHVLAGPT